MSAVFEKMDFLCRHESILKTFRNFHLTLIKIRGALTGRSTPLNGVLVIVTK